MGLITFLEKGMGDSKFRNNLLELYNRGMADRAAGQKLTNEGLTGLRDLDSEFTGLIEKGGLTDSLRRGFRSARGQAGDVYTRSNRALQEALKQRRLQGGGALTPEAIAEMQKEGENSAREQLFSATNDINMAEAGMEQTATQELYDRVLGIRDTIRQTGLTQEQQALLAQLQSLLIRKGRLDSISSSIMSGVTMGVSG